MTNDTETWAAEEQDFAPVTAAANEKDEENVLRLKCPIDINGVRVSALRYDFDAIDGKDMDAIAKHKLKALNNQPDGTPSVMNDVELRYTFYVAVTKAMPDVDVMDLQRLRLKDQMAGRALAQNFMLGLEDGEPETSDEL